MKISLYHKGFLLYSTSNEQEAIDKLKQYTSWFSSVEVRKELWGYKTMTG